MTQRSSRLDQSRKPPIIPSKLLLLGLVAVLFLETSGTSIYQELSRTSSTVHQKGHIAIYSEQRRSACQRREQHSFTPTIHTAFLSNPLRPSCILFVRTTNTVHEQLIGINWWLHPHNGCAASSLKSYVIASGRVLHFNEQTSTRYNCCEGFSVYRARISAGSDRFISATIGTLRALFATVVINTASRLRLSFGRLCYFGTSSHLVRPHVGL